MTSGSFFKSLLLGRVGLGMPGTWLLQGEAQAAEVLPAALDTDGAPSVFGHPGRYLLARPQTAVWRGLLERLKESELLLLRQQRLDAAIVLALVPEAVRTLLVVAMGELANPVGRVPGDFGHGLGGPPRGQEPEDLEVAPCDATARCTVAGLQFLDG